MNETLRAKMDTNITAAGKTWEDADAYPCGLMAKSFFNGFIRMTIFIDFVRYVCI